MWFQWVARTTWPFQPFQSFEVARSAWFRVKSVFPELISAILMPNHLHLVLPKESQQVTFRLAGWMGGITRKTEQKHLWQKIPEPREVYDSVHLKRLIRYVALNPCRKDLTPDPIQWYWSTYREVLGASSDSGDLNLRTALAFGEKEKNFATRFYDYVSADESVKIRKQMPVAERVPKFAVQLIESIRLAATAALRVNPLEVQKPGEARNLFVHLARRHGWRQTQVCAKICQASERTIQRIAVSQPPSSFFSAELCLGDPRLQIHGVHPGCR